MKQYLSSRRSVYGSREDVENQYCWSHKTVAILGANQMEQSREQFDFGLKECMIEASPDFDESPAKKTCWWKNHIPSDPCCTPSIWQDQPSVVSPWSTISLSTLTQENESSGGLFGASSSKGINGVDSEKLLIHLAGAPNTTMLAKPSTVVSQSCKLPPPMSLFGVLSIPQFDNALTTASTNDFCKLT